MIEFSGKNEPVKMVRIPGTPDRHTKEVVELPEPAEIPKGWPGRGQTVTLKNAENDDAEKEKFTVVDLEFYGGDRDDLDNYRYSLRALGSNPRNIVAYPKEIEASSG